MVNTYNAVPDGMCASMPHSLIVIQSPVKSHEEAHAWACESLSCGHHQLVWSLWRSYQKSVRPSLQCICCCRGP